jgi:hypothetical protein
MDTKALTSPEILGSDVASFLKTLDILEEIEIVATPVLRGLSYDINVVFSDLDIIPYKTGVKEKVPSVIAFRIFNKGTEDVEWCPLPYYDFGTTLVATATGTEPTMPFGPSPDSFFIQGLSKVIAYKNGVNITSQSQSADVQTYIIFVLKDKSGS